MKCQQRKVKERFSPQRNAYVLVEGMKTLIYSYWGEWKEREGEGERERKKELRYKAHHCDVRVTSKR